MRKRKVFQWLSGPFTKASPAMTAGTGRRNRGNKRIAMQLKPTLIVSVMGKAAGNKTVGIHGEPSAI